MDAHVGDTIQVEGQTVGRAPRHGRILETLGERGVAHYRVRWDDGLESFYYPGPDGHVVENAQPGEPVQKPRVLHLSGTVRSVMSAPPARIGADDTLRAVASALASSGVGALMVFEEERPIGIVSERDVVRSLAAGADPDEVWAADVMPAHTVWGSPDDTILQAADVMSESGVRHLPLREGDHLAGIVSVRDVLSAVLGTRPR